MNDKELRQFRDKTREMIDNLSTTNGSDVKTDYHCWFNHNTRRYYHPTQEVLDREEIESCIEMINSLLCYDYPLDWTPEKIVEADSKHERHDVFVTKYGYLTKHIEYLGREKVIELIKGQQSSIKDVRRGVYTDHEGCSYNSIIWN